ncbi:MAG TPA: hypothetical protein VF386_13585 [Usitatibacter sp.]
MRRLFIVLLASTAALSCEAAQDAAGRWSGRVRIPGREAALVIDLAKDAAGAWIGSMIVPGFDVTGAPLGNIKVGEGDVAFDAGDAFGAVSDGPAAFTARLEGRDSMSGQMRQGGNVAPFALKRVGEAQVQLPARSTPVAREIEGRWIGEYEMGGYPRHVTVDLVNHSASAASVDFVVVGKATTQVPIDFVSEEEGLLRLESRAYRINFEGRIHKGEGRIAGTFAQGSIEVPLVLRREGGKS